MPTVTHITDQSSQFTSRPTVNGTGVLLSGEIPRLPDTIVYTTGDQTISGVKTFATGIVSPLRIGNPGDVSDAEIQLWEISSDFYQSIRSTDGGFTFSRKDVGGINLEFSRESILLSQFPGIAYRFESGYEGTVPIDANVVHVTGGNETISGVKTFVSRPTVNGTGVLLSGEIRNTDYNYFTNNITLDNSYINLANSTSAITAILPSIASGRNYIVKNLNTGTLTVTGSALIDGNVNLKLYKNESAHLLGVNNIGYTGWITLNTNAGIS